MNKKQASQIANRNLSFVVITTFASITFMMQIVSDLYSVKSGLGTLNNVSYTLFQLRFVVREYGSN